MSELPPPTVPPTIPPPTGSPYPPPPPPPPPGGASSDRTIMLVLCYLGLLALIPLLTKKEDPEVQWHAKNGLALMIAAFAAWLVLFVLSFAIAMMHIPIVGCITTMAHCVVWLGYLVLLIFCIVKAVGGQRFRIPVVTDFAEKM